MDFTSKTAIKIVVGLISAVTLFHTCIMVKLIPYSITWGGRLQSDTEMYFFESISILINLFLLLILLMKGDFIHYKFSDKVVNALLWAFFAVFILNTIGNLFAQTLFEKLLSLLTGILALLLWVILKKKKH